MPTSEDRKFNFVLLTSEYVSIFVHLLRQQLQELNDKEEEHYAPILSVNNFAGTIESAEIQSIPTIEVKARAGEKVGRGWVFARDSVQISNCWSVFCESKDYSLRKENVFYLSNRLSAESPQDFVSECYEVILHRGADHEGLTVYTNLIRDQILTREAFVKILLESSEGLKFEDRLLIRQDDVKSSISGMEKFLKLVEA